MSDIELTYYAFLALSMSVADARRAVIENKKQLQEQVMLALAIRSMMAGRKNRET